MKDDPLWCYRAPIPKMDGPHDDETNNHPYDLEFIEEINKTQSGRFILFH